MPVARLAAAFLLAALSQAASADTGTLPLIPMPADVQRQSGQFLLHDGAVLGVPAGDAEALAIARHFTALLLQTRGLHLKVQSAAAGQIRLDRGGAASPDGEAYGLEISPQGVHITARDPAGLFYGSVTLWQLLTPDAGRGKTAVLPYVKIEDRPRFRWRGLMLDSARHFQSVAEIERLIDWMALHKLNVLQWHLTDDQGWRLEIKRYPKLTAVGGCRKAVGPDAALTGSPAKPYCGFYTQAQAREIVRYAAARYITVVPEIEMPGHAQAAIAAYPELGVTDRRPEVSTDWGVHPYLYNVDDHTFQFLEQVLDEVMAVFPSPYIDVGGDEALKDQWKASPAVQARRRELKLADESALQSWFIQRIEGYLHAHDRRLVGWDEILEGGLPPEATVMSWRGLQGAIDAAAQGHDVVLAPAPTLYLDNLQSDAHDEPPGRPAVESLKDVYGFNPLPPDIAPAEAPHVLGAQLNLWTEYMPTAARDEHAIFPRAAALAEITWSPATARDWPGFLQRLPAQLSRYRALGVHYADSAFAPRFDLQPAANGKIAVTVSDQATSGMLRYTTNGERPTSESALYTGTLELTPPLRLRAASFAADGMLLAERAQAVDRAALDTRNSDQLQACSNKLVLRLEAPLPLQGPRPVYRVDIMDTCWQWPAASLDGMHRLGVRLGTLPWNYQLGGDWSGVVVRPHTGADDALEVYADNCSGTPLAQQTLHPTPTGTETAVMLALPALSGRHALCFVVDGDPKQGLWAIDTVRLSP